MGRWAEVRCNCPGRNDRKRDPDKPYVFIYPCGHEDGCLFQVSPGFLFDVAHALKLVCPDEVTPEVWFPWFAKISDCRQYDDEYLAVPFDAVDEWRTEIEDVKAIDSGIRPVSQALTSKWRQHWESYFEDDWYRNVAKSVCHILDDGLTLCEASRQSGNPIEFRW